MEGKMIKISAPGKVILHGEHSVLYGKMALAVSLGLRSTVIIKDASYLGTVVDGVMGEDGLGIPTGSPCDPELAPTDNPKIHVYFPNMDLDETLPLKPIIEQLFTSSISRKCSWNEPTKIDHESHLKKVDGVLHMIRPGFDDLQSNQRNSLRCFLYAFGGIFGNSGLNISDFSIKLTSDLTVGAGTGSSASFSVCICAAMLQLVKLKDSENVGDFSVEEKNIVSTWAYNCEKITHGAPSGVDNTTCTHGSLVSFKKGEDPLLMPSPELRVLLVDSRVGRETSRLVAAVKDLHGRNVAAVDHIMEAMNHVALKAAELLKKLSNTKSKEDIEAIYKHLHELWEMNHCLLASLGVSHPVLEAIRSAARDHGLACKLTGAGGGGNAIVLIPPSTEESTVNALQNKLMNSGFRVTDTLVGGRGVVIHN